jgi:hypothetical protein
MRRRTSTCVVQEDAAAVRNSVPVLRPSRATPVMVAGPPCNLTRQPLHTSVAVYTLPSRENLAPRARRNLLSQ